jgi:hypothetical protein
VREKPPKSHNGTRSLLLDPVTLNVWGSQTRTGLHGLRVFVDQTVENGASLDLDDGLGWCWSDRVGWLLSQGPMRAMIVVVPGVFARTAVRCFVQGSASGLCTRGVRCLPSARHGRWPAVPGACG